MKIENSIEKIELLTSHVRSIFVCCKENSIENSIIKKLLGLRDEIKSSMMMKIN
jgi:hypothetical protein